MEHKNSIGIVSGKGGVGKTTVTANIGVSLVKDFGLNTVVLDANVLTSNLGLHLGFVREPVSLHDVLQKRLEVDKVIYAHSSGLNVIPSSLSVDAVIDVSALTKIIKYLAERYDFVIVDSAPGLSKEAIVVMDACDSFIVVTNPEMPAIADCIKTINMLEKRKKHIIGIAVNKITGRNYELSRNSIDKLTDYPVIAEVPYDDRVSESIAAKVPIVLFAPNSEASIKFRQLAGWLCDKPFMVQHSIWQRIIKFIFGG